MRSGLWWLIGALVIAGLWVSGVRPPKSPRPPTQRVVRKPHAPMSWIPATDGTADSWPAFSGVMPVRGVQKALFNLADRDGIASWLGQPGQPIPGTNWTLRSVSLRPTQAVIDVPGRGPVTLQQGETWLESEKRLAKPNPTRREAVAKARRRLNPFNNARSKSDQKLPGNIRGADGTSHAPVDIRSFAARGRETVVMVTSYLCGPSQRAIPYLVDWARAHPEASVVLVEIGATAGGDINFYSGVMTANGLSHVPWFFVIDKTGRVIATDIGARERLGI